jgi:uncharacterized protein (DUF736 family)
MRAVIYRVGQEPTVESIDDSLSGMQSIVGGYIETVYLDGEIILVCNEEGKMTGLPANRSLRGDVIMGDCFITAANEEGDFVSLTDEQMKKAMEVFTGEVAY